MSDNANDDPHAVVVVGGGWAGLAAAVDLTDSGFPVTLIEAAPRLGGRARTIAFGDQWVDNGPHALVGAYHELFGLLNRLKLDVSELFLRRSLKLNMRSLDGNDTQIRTAPLPAPLHMAAGCITASGLSLGERLRLLRFGRRISTAGQELEEDISVAALLDAQGQSNRLIETLWEPLCVAALNTPIKTASAQLFLRVLRNTFCGARANSDFLIPRVSMAEILPEPAQQFIESKHGKIIVGSRVHRLCITGEAITGVELADHTIKARHVIMAVAPTACLELLAPHSVLQQVYRQINRLDHYPICSVYLRYPRNVQLENHMIGIIGGTAEWMFDYRLCGQPGLMAIIISGPGPHMDLPNNELCARLIGEIAQLYPHWPRPDSTMVIREKRATFASVVGVNSRRPGHRTPVKGLWLAGDYTTTGLPGTLEGAVSSGLRCAGAIIHDQSDVGSGGPG
ncbi:MAG: hydroxysqualene dehydroxylase HpnE [Gammaproteobacteria bacterium]